MLYRKLLWRPRVQHVTVHSVSIQPTHTYLTPSITGTAALRHKKSAACPIITGMLPLRDELFCTTANFVLQCIASNNSFVNFVARCGVYFRRTHSLQLVWTPSFAVKVTMCHCTALAALTGSWLGIYFVFRDFSNYQSNAGIIILWTAIGQEWFGCNFIFVCCRHGFSYSLLVYVVVN